MCEYLLQVGAETSHVPSSLQVSVAPPFSVYPDTQENTACVTVPVVTMEMEPPKGLPSESH